MHAPPCSQDPGTGAGAMHVSFLALLPRIETHARIAFRHLGCPQGRDDAVAETIGLAWREYLRLLERGKDPAAFVSRFADYAARAVRRGRRVCGQEAGQEVLSPRAQARHDFAVLRLLQRTTLNGSPLEGAARQRGHAAAGGRGLPHRLPGLAGHLAGARPPAHRGPGAGRADVGPDPAARPDPRPDQPEAA